MIPYLERPYRAGVGIVLVNPAMQAFVAQRLDSAEPAWQMPQGGIDPGEDPHATALRELKEEIGTAAAEPLAETADWISYDLPPAIADVIWGGRYRGQRQKWFLMRFTGNDAEIDIATEHPEFSAWRWAEFESLPELIVPFKRPLYDAVVREFLPLVVEIRNRSAISPA